MKQRTFYLSKTATLATLLAVAAITAPAAQWGSIQANNRSESRPRIEPRDERAGFAPGREAEAAHRPEEHPVPEPGRPAEGWDHRAPRVEAPRAHEFEQAAHDRRHLDIEGERRQAFFWSGLRAGMNFGVLPSGYLSLSIGGQPCYYYQGVYYEPGPSGYVVVAPPLGAVVPELPPGAETMAVGPTVCYYAGGAFYVQDPQGFRVVQPPLGVIVPDLPPGAAAVNVGGTLYYQANGAYFLPVMQNGVAMYETAQP
jgi:hypothetical protein